MSHPILPGIDPEQPKPLPTDWFNKKFEISELFRPNQPVKEADLFAGRADQITRAIDGLLQPGQHIVIYGDRGVGKTSLVNVVSKLVLERTSRLKFFHTQCFDGDDYVMIWERAFKKHQWSNGDWASDDIDSSLSPDTIHDLVLKFNPNNKPVFIFDEFDRISDRNTKLRMAETIKLLSDETEATILIAGVGRTIAELFQEHESIKRSIKQIEMPRMRSLEVEQIIQVRLTRAGMTIEQQALDSIVYLARGMPPYAHLMGLHAGASALGHESLNIGMSDFGRCLANCLQEVGESTKQAYAQATQSSQPNNLLRQTLLACSVAEQDEFGSFTAGALRGPIKKILKKDRGIPDYARHLNAFCSPEKGRILEKTGTPKNYRYRFADPMVQSYVMMRGVVDGMLKTKPQD